MKKNQTKKHEGAIKQMPTDQPYDTISFGTIVVPKGAVAQMEDVFSKGGHCTVELKLTKEECSLVAIRATVPKVEEKEKED